MIKFINTTEFISGLFVGFVLTLSVTSYIMVTEFVNKKFLQMNNVYIEGKYYKLEEKKKWNKY